MKPEAHLQRAEELRASLAKMHATGSDVGLAVEAVHGAIHQYAAGKILREGGGHHDKHQGIEADLRKLGHAQLADRFRELETLRAGRWYGGKGNGHTVQRALEILEAFRAWAES
ncbi:MAG: hypothetical protein ACYDBQ_02500 [Thermoplasmatota archaeon]